MTGYRERLFTCNPFTSAATADPWERSPDIGSINEDAYAGVMTLITRCAKDPGASLAGLVLGEAGCGKTHLLGRIFRASRTKGQRFVFVYVNPVISPDAPVQHLAKNLIRGLSRDEDPGHPGFTSLDRLVFLMVEEYLGQSHNDYAVPLARMKKDPYGFLAKNFLHFANRRAVRDMAEFYAADPDVSETAVRVLLQLPVMSRRRDVLRWCRGEWVEDEERDFPGSGRSSYPAVPDPEAFSYEIVRTISALLHRHMGTVVICFDQLETIRSDVERIRAFGAMVEACTNQMHGVLPVAFIRAGLWDPTFRSAIDLATVQRMEHHTLYLYGFCSVAEACDLIRERVKGALKEDWEAPAEWLVASLKDTLIDGYTPRQVITLANRALVQGHSGEGRGSPEETLQRIFSRECKVVFESFDEWPPDADQILFALGVSLKNQTWVENFSRTKDSFSFLFDPGEGKPLVDCFCLVNVNEHHLAVGTCLLKGIEFVQLPGPRCCLYITDPRCVVTRDSWTSTREKLDLFRRMGGILVQPPPSEMSRWYALTSLLFRVSEGDITCPDDDGNPRACTDEEIEAFLRSVTLLEKSFFLPGEWAARGSDTSHAVEAVPKKD